MSSHAFVGPGDTEPNAFQRALVSAAAYFDAKYRRAHGTAPETHDIDTAALVVIVHCEAGGRLSIARFLIDELFPDDRAYASSLGACWIQRMWWLDCGRPRRIPKLPEKRQKLIEQEIGDRSARAVQIEREREERARRRA